LLLETLKQPLYNDDWIDSYAVMKRLGISKRTLQTYRSEGLLPYSQIRGIHFYKSNDIDEMLEKHYYRVYPEKK